MRRKLTNAALFSILLIAAASSTGCFQFIGSEGATPFTAFAVLLGGLAAAAAVILPNITI